ncbi:histidine kinase [Elizabethkingia meningoseptica]|uniref:sensor histidine kinase n=1 Tax=Elizabethkingia meningoseptica TaxID=238 RepID=UPI000332C810|nr:ATP-binding protein [Elizabethkingia meningoseptica]AQX05223.1 histidine kinase [Elizabethkingia meningoseptica]AQX47268.1 histidine kinase [Elizabethkingia meningoseptica]EOR31053.1 histidine kinase [Elizabethkingia meningoseptica ATCC 13253 = NBRC 12535]KUY21809.1 histidine kinase [Elizabethkingia meningoseptica]MDE5489337.1 GHKL domain-containing protein [Elizabethkingia meningoseptica]
MKIQFYISQIAFLVLSLICGVLAYDFFESKKWITALLFLCISIAMIILNLRNSQRAEKEAEQIMEAILQKDFSLFPEKNQRNRLKQQAVKLYYEEKENNTDILSFKVLYENILNQLDIGIMILKEAGNDWEVFYANPKFIDSLKVPKYNIWSFYQEKIPDFYKLVENTGYRESQDFMEVSINQERFQTYSIRTTRLETPREDFCIISMESVQKIIERKEKMAWNNLMKVLSHELLNTLTPVNSLIRNMEYITDQESISQEDQEEIKESLRIVNNKSEQLLSFINSYRQVAELPKPKIQKVYIKPVIEKVLQLMESELQNKNITLVTNIKNYQILADEKMLERSLVNLLTNALHAVDGISDGKIKIQTEQQNTRTIIQIEDNGTGINDQISDKIFLPFFTTRSSGSGIGLTLTKSIMEAHNGYITFRKLQQGSSFELWFT